MAKPVQLAEQYLNRSRIAYSKGKTVTVLVSLVEALKIILKANLHSMDMQKLAPLLRETCQNAGKIKEVQELAKGPIAYEKGKEKALLVMLIPIIKTIHAEKQHENIAAKRARKLKIDKAIAQGRHCLENNKFDEAQQAFRLASNLHVDEDAMYSMIADSLHAHEAYKESFEYLRQALLFNPNDRKASEMVCTAAEKVGNTKRGELLLEKIAKKKGATPHLNLGLARLAFKAKRWADAQKFAEQALAEDDRLLEAKKLLKKAQAKA